MTLVKLQNNYYQHQIQITPLGKSDNNPSSNAIGYMFCVFEHIFFKFDIFPSGYLYPR